MPTNTRLIRSRHHMSTPMRLPDVVAKNLRTIRVRGRPATVSARAAASELSSLGLIATTIDYSEADLAAAPVAAAAAPANFVISLPAFAYQEQLNWCWASVGVALAVRAGRRPPGFTQCAFASEFVGPGACCPPGVNGADCNRIRSFDDVLLKLGWNYDSTTSWPSYLSFQQVVALLNDWRAVVAQIRWSSGGTHFIIINGYANLGGSELVYVRDPFAPTSGAAAPVGFDRRIPYNQLFNYSQYPSQGELGRWFWSFYPRVKPGA